MRKKVTLQQIAEEAGLSRQTVSHVLGSRSHLFREDTVKLVLETSERLGYRPHSGASSIRSGKFSAIGWICSARQSHNVVSPGLFSGVQDAANERQFHVVMSMLRDELLTGPEKMPKLLRMWMVDGLLLTYTHDIPAQLLDLIERHQIPVVWINADLPTNVVRPDDLQAGRLAVEYLIGKGHTNIAYYDSQHDSRQIFESIDHYSIQHRRLGYEQAMKANGLTPVVHAAPYTSTPEQPFLAPIQSEILEIKPYPTAIITYSPRGIARLREHAEKLGRAVEFLTFNYGPFELDDIPITTLVLPEHEIGRAAFEMLVRKIENKNIALPSLLIPLKLVSAEGQILQKENRTP